MQESQPFICAWVTAGRHGFCYNKLMRFVRPYRLAAGVALLVLALLAVRYERHLHHRLLHTGDAFTPISVATLTGSRAMLAASGRPTVINVFATWCGPCREEAPAFSALAKRLERRGVLVIGIDQEEGADEVAAFAREFRLGYPLYIDRTNVTHDILGARMIPNTIYVDASGIIRWQHAGPLTAQDLAQLARTAG